MCGSKFDETVRHMGGPTSAGSMKDWVEDPNSRGAQRGTQLIQTGIGAAMLYGGGSALGAWGGGAAAGGAEAGAAGTTFGSAAAEDAALYGMAGEAAGTGGGVGSTFGSAAYEDAALYGSGGESGLGGSSAGFDLGADAYEGTGIGDSSTGLNGLSPEESTLGDSVVGTSTETTTPTVNGNPSSGWKDTLGNVYKGYKSGQKYEAIGKGLQNLYAGYREKRQAEEVSRRAQQGMDQLSGMYQPGTAEATQMQREMERQDAAHGRRSQYGVRATSLAAQLANKRAEIMGGGAYQGLSSLNRRADTEGSNAYNNALSSIGGSAIQYGLGSMFGS